MLDPAKYELADQPWSYDTVDGILKVWGYTPLTNDPNLLDQDGLLTWQKFEGGVLKSFVIRKPRWRASGFSQPVWPAKVITQELARQQVYLRAEHESPDAILASLSLSSSGHTT